MSLIVSFTDSPEFCSRKKSEGRTKQHRREAILASGFWLPYPVSAGYQDTINSSEIFRISEMDPNLTLPLAVTPNLDFGAQHQP